MTKDEALKLALEALESLVQPDNCEHGYWWEDCPNDECEKVKDMKAITAIKEALAQPDDLDVWKVRALQAEAVIEKFMAQPEQEPVAFASHGVVNWIADKQFQHEAHLYSAPQRTWVGLTDEEIKAFDTWHDNREEEVGWVNPSEIVAYIEAKLKEKNT